MLAVPGREWGMLGGYPAEFGVWAQRKLGTGLGVELGGVDGDALVEEGVEVGAEEEDVEAVEALGVGVGVALGPGLGVAGAEEFGNDDAGETAQVPPQ